jgi:glutamine amidotransferase-like uncharacterized protein
MKHLISIFILLSVIVPIKAQNVLIYSDDGAWEDGIVALENFFEEQGVSTQRIYATDLNSDNWNKDADAILFPGGYAYNYQLAISLEAIDEIRDYVSSGGAYIGICAGAYFASMTVEWEGGNYPYELGLFDGTATGSLDYIAPWPEFAMTKLTMNKENPINYNSPNSISTLYYGGPIFTPNPGVEVNTVATWDEANNTAAIINFEYKNGRVLLLGPHLEIEEDDDRDGTNFASTLADQESDWASLWSGYQWVTNSSLSTDIESTIISDVVEIDGRNISVTKNNSTSVNSLITLYNLNGIHLLSGKDNLNISSVASGIYFIKVDFGNKSYFEKISIVD